MNFTRADDLAAGMACSPLPESGYTWTMASLLSRFLDEAEDLFGPRDHAFTPVGVEFCDRPHPQTWFPGNRGHVAIQLSENARLDPNRALFQLAHEVVHLLAPGSNRANVTEEGLASLFSDAMAERYGSPYRTTKDGPYRRAMALAAPLLAEPSIVRAIRSVEPTFALWTPALLLDVAPAVGSDLAKRLCARFEHDHG